MRLRNHLWLALSVPLALFGAMSAAIAAPPRRIVSLSLCADQYLLVLADPSQIVALNRFSHDSGMSWGVARARRFPAIRGSAEEMLTLKPDLVFTAGFGTPAALAVLKSRHVKTVDLAWDDSFASIESTVRRVAVAVGHPERGEALIATMWRQLASMGPPAGKGRIAAYYQRRGYLTGKGTLIDDMMRRAGLVNLAGAPDRPMLPGRLSIEQMAMARPDFLIVDHGGQVRDKGTEMLEHPLLKRAVPPSRWINIPEALTTCGGPSYPDAMSALYRGIRRADRMEHPTTDRTTD
jgi:iron complex transport system substrate-binding protein